MNSRLRSVDALRGAVMIIMALDHTRDFFHSAAAVFQPEDLTRTTALLFFTRWITHFCAPVFMFTAGMGAGFKLHRGGSRSELSRFLISRGLWLVILEVTVMRLIYNFTFSAQHPLFLLVLYVLGACMIVLSVLIYLPVRVLASLSVAVIFLHNILDVFQARQFGSSAWIWNVLHESGAFLVGGMLVLVGYPLVPWFALMAAGFCFSSVFKLEPEARQRILIRAGITLTLLFMVLRAVNVYGNPRPWSIQSSPVFTLLSFLNCNKYPPSLDFLLMTLGPALVVLAFLDRLRFCDVNPLIVFGRVPLFYFVIHFFWIHALAVIAAWLRYGAAASVFTFSPLPSMGGPSKLFPPGFGYNLLVTYCVWLFVVASLYPLCRWFAAVKSRRRDWWLSYL